MGEKREIEIALKSGRAEASADRLNKKVKGVGASADKTEKSLFTMAKAAAAVSAALVTRQVVQYADAWTNVNNRLRAATTTQDEFSIAQKGVIEIAQEAGVSIEGVADSYSRLAQATSELGVSQDRVLTVTRNVALALKAGGATAQEVSSIAVQLGQGLGAGALQGDELRSILESSIPIAKALAKEFNTTTGELKKLGANGELTSARVVSALENMDRKSLTFTKDIAGGFTEVSNALTVYVGGVDESLGVTTTLVGSMSTLAKNIDVVVDGVTTLAVLFGAKYLGALTSAAAAAISKSAANAKLATSELALLKAAQARATQEALAAVQLQAAAKRQLAAAHVTGLRSKAITALAIANGRLIATEAALATSTNAYTVAAGRATIASRALSSSMAFIGGPVGLAVIATAALFTFTDGAESAEESAAKAANEVNFLADSFANLSKNQKATELNKTESDMKALSAKLVTASENLNKFKKFSDSPFKVQGIRKSESEIIELNKQMDALALKQQALVGSPELSGGIKRNFVDGVEVKPESKKPDEEVDTSADDAAFESLLARLERETGAIQAELEVRRALEDGVLTEREARHALDMQAIFFRFEEKRVAIEENTKLGAERQAELIAEINEQELAAERLKQSELTGIAQDGANDRKSTLSQQLGDFQKYSDTAFAVAGLFGAKSEKQRKKFAKGQIIINTAIGITRAFSDLGWPAGIPAAIMAAATGASQLAAIGSSGGNPAPSAASPVATPTVSPAPALSAQQTERTINIVGLENFGPDDMLPMTKAQFIDYMGQDEDVNVAVNQGQQSAQRVGAI